MAASEEVSQKSVMFNLLGKDVDEAECPQTLQYLDSLSSAGINTLNQEPERLKSEHEQLIEQTRSLAFQNYRTFITAADCSRQIYKDFNIIEDNLHSLESSIPDFKEKIECFSKTSQETNAKRKQNFLVLSRHTQILEILEIPQLMDTCVRNNYYEEAIELINYVKRLEKKLSSIKIVMDISKDVKKATRLMLTQLLLQLKGNIQLPACLRTVGYLRQLETFNEAELRIRFLQARNCWFDNVVKSIPSKDAYYHVTKVIEASRIHLFDIVTQYRAIFSDDDPIFIIDGDSNTNYSNILHAWIGRKISEFMLVLENDLDRGVSGRMDAVLSQCMYFGLSFGRVGADFRSLLIPIFNRNLMKVFTEKLERTTKCFEDTLANTSLSQVIKVFQDHAKTMQKNPSDASLSPPQELLDFPVLAVYTNGILGCFNEVRNFASVALSDLIRRKLKKSLERATNSFSTWFRLESQSVNEKDKNHLKRLVLLLTQEFLPFVDRCFQAIFKSSTLNTVFGHSKARNISNDISSSCIDRISEQLPEFLPEMIPGDQGVDMEFKNQSEDAEEIGFNREISSSKISGEEKGTEGKDEIISKTSGEKNELNSHFVSTLQNESIENVQS